MNRYIHSSVEEQALFFYISSFFPNAINQAHFSGLEADILIDSIKCIVEYDGGYWHKNKADFDYSKTIKFNSLGYYVIRVRHSSLEPLKEFRGVVIVHNPFRNGLLFSHTSVSYIVETIHELSKFAIDENKRLAMEQFSLLGSQFLCDYANIVAPLFQTKVENSIADCFGSELWDYELNGELNPENIDYYSFRSKKLHLICPRGFKYLANVEKWCFPNSAEYFKSDTQLLINIWRSSNCSYISSCRSDCWMKEELFELLLKERIPVDELHEIYHSLYYERYFGILLENAFSDSDPSFLDSIKRKYSPLEGYPESASRIPCLWVSNKRELDLLKRFIKCCEESKINYKTEIPLKEVEKRIK